MTPDETVNETASALPGDAGAARRSGRRGRVLVVHSSDELYGSDRIVLEVVAELVAADELDVTVWLPSDVAPGPLGPMLRELGARVERHPLPILRRMKLSPGGFLRLGRDAVRTLARLRGRHFDLVYCATSACLPVAPLARLTGVRRVVGHLQEPWSAKDRVGLRPLASACTALVAVSHSVLGASGLAEDPRAVVVHNGVPHRSRELPTAPPEHRRPHYVIASRWNPHKGHGTLLRAWDAAGCPGELVILGAVPAVGLGIDVAALVKKHVSRPETVLVVGEVDDATPYLQAADAVVLPTDTLEGFGLVTVEAFSEGRPVIASRSGGPEEVIDDGVTGWLFDREDVDGLASLFRDLDVATLGAAGRRAEAAYHRDFTPARMRSRIAAVVDGELGRPTRITTELAEAS
ncbi:MULTISPECIES: glycosyltransferase [unclassified Frondihabitans]|uniref:glycosyltransferase n=1 Tax=unclassified Frondihabitans TaxID=2626248 RepID=UPI0006F6779C|nr:MULTISPECIES: glycosyltransferase [unclassified Frondihabitans]KQQ27409.1 hypothetical protein ASF54_00945 [Frondihabitans sp. Leaf304]RPE74991.1 glycosyltransferase involved in cell wall biosynthesis [Frondihabitans sp. PhB153]RPF04235.1 glycosyltransferase involved in cell wall biosynthesis [Frondihabitans sp. PhB161]